MTLTDHFISNYKKYKNQEIILYPHLGLGDAIICNGLVNNLSNYFLKINLIANKQFHEQLDYLYEENSSVNIISEYPEVVNNLDKFVENLAINTGLKVLRVSQLKSGKPFYREFYKSVNLPYRYSYNKFYLPEDTKRQHILKNHLIETYQANPLQYALVHKDSSIDSYNLEITNKSQILVEKESDQFNNIFLYKDVIKDAKEIHCVNSSFVHLVDRVDTGAKLFYHDVRGGIIKLKKKWKIIKYENKD